MFGGEVGDCAGHPPTDPASSSSAASRLRLRVGVALRAFLQSVPALPGPQYRSCAWRGTSRFRTSKQALCHGAGQGAAGTFRLLQSGGTATEGSSCRSFFGLPSLHYRASLQVPTSETHLVIVQACTKESWIDGNRVTAGHATSEIRWHPWLARVCLRTNRQLLLIDAEYRICSVITDKVRIPAESDV